MDLNELLSRHQVALIDMANGPSPAVRAWAEVRADYYAECIISLRTHLGADNPITDGTALKRIMCG